MRLTQYLSEKINLNYKLKAANYYDKGDIYEIEFDVGDREYTFHAGEYSLAYEDKRLREFLGAPNYKGNTKVWDIEFREEFRRSPLQDPHSITGTAGSQAMEVFSALAVCMKHFVLKKRPDFITFSAKESSRIRVYDRLAKIIPSVRTTAGTYEYLGTVAIREKVYVFKRKGMEIKDDE